MLVKRPGAGDCEQVNSLFFCRTMVKPKYVYILCKLYRCVYM